MTNTISYGVSADAQGPGTPHWHRNWAARVSFSSILVIAAAVVTVGLVSSPEASHSLRLSSDVHKRGVVTRQPPAKGVSGCTLVPMKLSRVVHQPDGTTIYDFTGDGTWSDEEVPPTDAVVSDPVVAIGAGCANPGGPEIAAPSPSANG